MVQRVVTTMRGWKPSLGYSTSTIGCLELLKLPKKIFMEETEMTEKEIETSILDWINQQPKCFAFKINTIGVYDENIEAYRKTSKFVLKGTSDIIGIWKGKPLAVEVKSKTGRLSQEQKAFINRYIDLGGIAFKVSSLEEVVRNLEYYDKNGRVVL